MTYELEIWGGVTNYIWRLFPQRKFKSRKAAERYMARIAEHLDEMGVRAAHPMELHEGE